MAKTDTISLASYGKLADPLLGKGEELQSLTTEVHGSIVPATFFMPYQSYFGSTKLEQAIIKNAINQSILFPSKAASLPNNITCYGIGNSPMSDIPIAVQFLTGKSGAASTVYVLSPGQIIRPRGLGTGGKEASFSGIKVGMPAGYMGGGRATYHLIMAPDAELIYANSPVPELCFHRQRLQILDQSLALPAISNTAGTHYNWPEGFPWSQCLNAANQPQVGQNVGRFKPTRTELRFNATTVGGEAYSILMRGTDEFDQDPAGTQNGTVVTTNVSFVGQFNTPASAVGGITTLPVFEVLGGPLNALAGDQCRVDIVSAAAALIGSTVDILRFGLMG